MKNLVNANIQTMSSKEIAELTGKEHKHILRDIRDMMEKLASPETDSVDYKEIFRDNGQLSEILLNKELSIILVSGYSVQMRAKIVRRWIELENKVIQEQTPKLLTTEEYQSEVRKAKLEVFKRKLEIETGKVAIHNCKVDAAKAKLEELKTRVYSRIKLMNEKHARILAKNETNRL